MTPLSVIQRKLLNLSAKLNGFALLMTSFEDRGDGGFDIPDDDEQGAHVGLGLLMRDLAEETHRLFTIVNDAEFFLSEHLDIDRKDHGSELDKVEAAIAHRRMKDAAARGDKS